MSLWNWKKCGWVNTFLAILLILSVVTSICSTGIRTKFKGFAPNSSFQGKFYPEVGAFNLLLYVSAILGFASVALRYSYIMDQVQAMPTVINYLNTLSASTGIISFLGLIMTASFSVSLVEMVSTFQSVGAYLFIGVGLIFTILQTLLTYTSSRISVVFILRICLSVTLMGTFISSIVFAEKSKEYGSLMKNESLIQVDDSAFILTENNEEGHMSSQLQRIQLIAYALERISVTVYALFFLSFFREFQTISTYIIVRPFINPQSNDIRSSSLTVNERV